MTTSETTELDLRLARLERHYRRLGRACAAGLCLLTIAGLGAFATRPDPVVRAEQVELITGNGTRQAALNADSAGVTLTLFTRKGRPASAMRLTDSTLTLLDASGREIATLGGPRVRHLE